MALIDRKVNDWSQAVSSLDDKPKMTAAALKAAFDSNSNQLKPAINGIIDDLTGSQGALNIGLSPIDGLSGSNVQAVLQAISLLIKSNDVDLASLERLFTADGASLVGLQPVSGVSASNLQQAIISLADTISKVDPYLGNPVAISQGGTGAKTAQKAIYNIGCMPRENLLDNAYFVGGGTDGNFPINPKGLKKYSTPGYSIPRWKITHQHASIEIVDDGIILRNSATEFSGGIISFLQNIARNINQETVTYSIIVSELFGDWFMAYGNAVNGNKKINSTGLTSITISAEQVTLNGKNFYLFKTSKNANDYIKFQVLKLEKGDTQTLALEDTDGNLHLFETPDYASKLLECQRYYYRSLYGDNGFGTSLQVSPGSHYIPFKATMRAIPNIKLYGTDVDSFIANLVSSNGFILTNTDTVYTRACDFEAVAEL